MDVWDSKRTALVYEQCIGFLDRVLLGKWRRLLWDEVQGPRVLEVGLGAGSNIVCYRAEHQVTAIDINEHLLERARRRARDEGVSMKIAYGDVQQLPFPRDSFDSVVATFVFCSVRNPLRGLEELLRVLRPGGELFLLEHVRPQGRLGQVVESLAGPLYRLTGDHVARDTEALTNEAGFHGVVGRNLCLNVVQFIRARKNGGEV